MCHITSLYSNAQDRLLYKDTSYPCTNLAQQELAQQELAQQELNSDKLITVTITSIATSLLLLW